MPQPPRLSAVAVENYKAFEDRADLQLRPLTLLYGFNSVGKSALLRALPFLAASAEGRFPPPLALSSKAVRGAAFSDLVSRNSSTPAIRFTFDWRDKSDKGLCATYAIRNLPDLKTHVIEEITLRIGNGAPIHFLWEPSTDDKEGGDLYRAQHEDEEQHFRLSFRGLQPLIEDRVDIPARYSEILTDLRHHLSSFGSSVHWLSAVRVIPERFEQYLGAQEPIGPNGERAGQALAYETAGDQRLRRLVSRWYEEATDHDLTLTEFALGDGEGFSLNLTDRKSKTKSVNLVDTGEGMGQVLPVLTLCALAADHKLGKFPILCIEHPELHLQPSTHGRLASYFSRIVHSAPETTLVVETHSETLLLETQLQIATGRLRSEDVIVYWLSRGEEGNPTLERVTFDDLGRPVARNWPHEAFSSSTDIAKQIVSERRARENANLSTSGTTNAS